MFSFKENGQNYTQRGHWVSHAVSTGSGSQERLSCPGFSGARLDYLCSQQSCVVPGPGPASAPGYLPGLQLKQRQVFGSGCLGFRLFGIQVMRAAGPTSLSVKALTPPPAPQPLPPSTWALRQPGLSCHYEGLIPAPTNCKRLWIFLLEATVSL